MQKQILHNQSLFDIAIQYNGTVLSVFEIALANSLSITDSLTPGESIEVAKSLLYDGDLVTYFSSKGLVIATGLNDIKTDVIIPQLGIGTMTIGSTFIVG